MIDIENQATIRIFDQVDRNAIVCTISNEEPLLADTVVVCPLNNRCPIGCLRMIVIKDQTTIKVFELIAGTSIACTIREKSPLLTTMALIGLLDGTGTRS